MDKITKKIIPVLLILTVFAEAKINTSIGVSTPSFSDFAGLQSYPCFSLIFEKDFSKKIIAALDFNKMIFFFPVEHSWRGSLQYVFTEFGVKNSKFGSLYSSMGLRMRWTNSLIENESYGFFSFFDMLTGINFDIPKTCIRIRAQIGLEYNFLDIEWNDSFLLKSTTFFPEPSIIDMEYVYPRTLLFVGVRL